MKRITIRSLSVLLALLIALTLSVCALADGESSDTAEESSEAESSAAESSEAQSKDESSAADSSTAESSSEAESSVAESSSAAADETESASSFPWARVITLIVIVALIAAAIILSKTQTALGQKIAMHQQERHGKKRNRHHDGQKPYDALAHNSLLICRPAQR